MEKSSWEQEVKVNVTKPKAMANGSNKETQNSKVCQVWQESDDKFSAVHKMWKMGAW